MTSAQKRLDAVPSLFPKNSDNLNVLRGDIVNTHSVGWPQMPHKLPDATFSLGAQIFGSPGLIIEVGDSQHWKKERGVRNKAIQYEDDSNGMAAGVLYLGYGDKSIGMIGSKTVFPNCPPAKYLDGTVSTHAVEVIPLTSLTDPAYSECLLVLKFAYLGAGQVLLRSLEPEEHDMGFSFTFKEILQMMEMVDKAVTSPAAVSTKQYRPLNLQRPWDLVASIKASLFKTPPKSPPYCLAQACEGNPEHSDPDKDSDEEESSSSDWSHDKKYSGKASASRRRSVRSKSDL